MANRTGASALIMRTSSSLFMICSQHQHLPQRQSMPMIHTFYSRRSSLHFHHEVMEGSCYIRHKDDTKAKQEITIGDNQMLKAF